MHVPHFPPLPAQPLIPGIHAQTQSQRCMEIILDPTFLFWPSEEDIDILHEKLHVLTNYLLSDCARLD